MDLVALECIICASWPERDRWALREMIDRLPLKEIDHVCDECLMAFWQNCTARAEPEEPGRH